MALPLVPLAIGGAVLAFALTRKKLPQGSLQGPPPGPGGLAQGPGASGPTHIVVPTQNGGLHVLPLGGGPSQPVPPAPPIPAVVPPPAPVPTPGVQHAMVTTHDTGASGNLFIRSSPSVIGSSPNASPNNIVGSAPHGSIVQVTGPQAGLFLPVLVESSGLAGFAAAQFLTMV